MTIAQRQYIVTISVTNEDRETAISTVNAHGAYMCEILDDWVEDSLNGDTTIQVQNLSASDKEGS